jgi:glycosyltransferase involved in cell wall biosynthesis
MSRLLKPSISYFVFCKNEKERIEKTIENILIQKIENLQIVVQDGGSNDGTLKILHKFKSRIDLKSEKDGGPGDAFWRAIKRCKNDYVGCLNCDEKLRPSAIQDNYDLLKSSQSDVIFRDSKLIDENNNFLAALSNIFEISIDELINKLVKFLENDKDNIIFTYLNNGDICELFKTKENYINYIKSSSNLDYDTIGELLSAPNVLNKNGLVFFILNKNNITIKKQLDKDRFIERYYLNCLNYENSFMMNENR